MISFKKYPWRNYLILSGYLGLSLITFLFIPFPDSQTILYELLGIYILLHGIFFMIIIWKFPVKPLVIGIIVLIFTTVGYLLIPIFLAPISPLPPSYAEFVSTYQFSPLEFFGLHLFSDGVCGFFAFALRTQALLKRER